LPDETGTAAIRRKTAGNIFCTIASWNLPPGRRRHAVQHQPGSSGCL